MDQNTNSGFETEQTSNSADTNNGTNQCQNQDQKSEMLHLGFRREKKNSETFTDSMKNLQVDTNETDDDQDDILASRILLLDLCPGSLTLDTLPLEILLHICDFLEAKEVVETLSNVCVMFNELFSRDTYWKTRICKRWPKPYPPVYEENFDWRQACIDREEQHHVWSNTKETCVHIKCRQGIFAPVDSVHLMKEGTLLASGSRDRYLNLLDLTKYDSTNPSSASQMKIHSDEKAHKGWIWSMASFDDTLVTGSWDTYIKMWDLGAGCAEIKKFKCNSAVLGLHAQDNFIVGASYNQFLYMIDPRTGSGVKKKFHRRPVLCVVADDNFIISGSEDRTLSVYDRRASRVFKTIQMDSYAMTMNFGHNQLWVGDKDGNIHLFDTTHGSFEPVKTYDVGHKGKVTGIIYTQGALFTCSTDKTIKVMEPNLNPAVITTLESHTGEVARISFQNGVLASAGSDITVGVYIPKTLYETFHANT